MGTIIKIDSRSKAAKSFLEYVKTLSFAKVEDEPRYTAETEKVISDAKKGIGVKRAKNSKDLFKSEKTPNKETVKAMNDAKNGKGVTRVKSFKEYKEATK